MASDLLVGICRRFLHLRRCLSRAPKIDLRMDRNSDLILFRWSDADSTSSSAHFDTSIVPYADREELQVIAHAVHDGRIQSAGFAETRQTVDVEAEEIQTATVQTLPVRSGIRLSIYGRRPEAADSNEASGRGSKHRNENIPLRRTHPIRRKAATARNFRNPGAFDYQGYLSDRGIVALGSAKIEDVAVLPGFSGTALASLRTRLHRGVIAKVHQLWPAREAALLDAMVIGEEAFIDRDTRLDFQRSGTYHVLVVSGMNVEFSRSSSSGRFAAASRKYPPRFSRSRPAPAMLL